MKSNIFNDEESFEVAANLARDAETPAGDEGKDINVNPIDDVTTSTKTRSFTISNKAKGCIFFTGLAAACGAIAGSAYGGVEANKAGMVQIQIEKLSTKSAKAGTPACSDLPGTVFEDETGDVTITIITDDVELSSEYPTDTCGFELELVLPRNMALIEDYGTRALDYMTIQGGGTLLRSSGNLSFQGCGEDQNVSGEINMNLLSYKMNIVTIDRDRLRMSQRARSMTISNW